MAKTKAPGTGLDRRNGRGHELAAPGPLKRFGLPRDRAYRKDTVAAWRLAWTDPVAGTWTPGDRPILLRWALHADLHAEALEKATEDPIVPGHAKQPVRSPWFEIAAQHMGVVTECERQLGLGGWNRSRLGLVIATGRLTLEQLNASIMRDPDGPSRRDPRECEEDPRLLLPYTPAARHPGKVAGRWRPGSTAPAAGRGG